MMNYRIIDIDILDEMTELMEKCVRSYEEKQKKARQQGEQSMVELGLGKTFSWI